MTENLFKKNISEIYEDIKKTFKEKDYSKLLDYVVIGILLSAILFILVYKVSINLEKIIFDSNTLVLSGKTKAQIPELMLYVLFALSLIKWILSARTGNPRINEDKISNTKGFIKISFRKTIYIIKKSTLYTIGLLFIIASFFIAKIPYWDISFTVNHPLKYNTYVDPAFSMFRENDPFFIQRKYMHNPITDSRGMGIQYGSLPLLEWTLFAGYKIFNGILSIEAITRMVMITIGCIALISFYHFTKKIFDERFALLATLLLSINSIFNLSSFVTVYDILTFSITFFSFSLIVDSFKNSNNNKLFTAGLLLGIGMSIKINILLWSLPFIFIYLFYSCRKDIRVFIQKIILYLLGTIIPYIIVKTSLNFFPTKEPKYFIIFFIAILILACIIKYTDKISTSIGETSSECIDYIKNHKKILWLIPLIIIIGIKFIYSTSVSEEFLTDWKLLFNTDLYFRFLTDQIIPYIGKFPFYILAFSIPLFIFYCKGKRENLTIFALIFGSLFYILIASKALFFHSYYWLFIIASFIIFITWGILFMGDNFFRGIASTSYIIILTTGLFFNLSATVKSKLNREYTEVYDVIEYINSEDFEEGTSFIDQASISYLTIKTNLYRVYDSEVFADHEFRDSVKKIGFLETMRKYKILYLITLNSVEPDLTIFANSFSNDDLETTSYRRTDQILSILYPSVKYYSDLDIRGKIIQDNNLYDQFKLIKEFGAYKIYKLSDACFKTVIE